MQRHRSGFRGSRIGARVRRRVPGYIHPVDRKLYSHAEAAEILRRAGYSQELIDNVLRDVPDPIDPDRDDEAFFKHGLSFDVLVDRMGGSP